MEKKDGPSRDTSWGGVAGWYDGLLEGANDSYQSKVIMPNLVRVAAPAAGMHTLDVACGQGYFARAFASAGATVTGCDISQELVGIARKHAAGGGAGAEQIRYEVAPADKLAFAADGSADLVTIVLALQNIENMAGALAEAARALKPRGRLILVLNHPAFRIPQRSSWQWDDKAAVQYRRIDAYMSDDRIKIDMTPGEENARKKRFTVSFHRPLQVYFKALGKAGLAVTRLEEWVSHKQSGKGPRATEEDRIRKEIPMFLMLEATKV